jgi:glycosyltransferase involved in cell wall biosynthesis
MRILVIPRDENPYQSLLYDEMRKLDAEITYLGQLTPSHTVNLALLPLETMVRRAFGARMIHMHWAFAFGVPGRGRCRPLRRVAQIWFALWLFTNRCLGMKLVWTAHNVLPHEPIFADDAAARRTLVASSNLVIAHSKSTLLALGAIGAEPRRAVVIPHGPIGPGVPLESLRPPGAGAAPRRFLFFGRIQAYKGVEDLLSAFALLPDEVPAHLTVAGSSDNEALRKRLESLAQARYADITLRVERIPEAEVTSLLEQADVVVLPFRRVTTSGSAMLALGHGRPLIVPDLDALADLPDQAVMRYDGSLTGLAAALEHVALADDKVLAAMGAAARNYAELTSWQEIAERTIAEMRALPSGAHWLSAPSARRYLKNWLSR